MHQELGKSFHSTTRRRFLGTAGSAGAAAVAAACAPAGPPPSPEPAPRASEGTPAWEQEWQRWVSGAKQEGKVVVSTIAGAGYRKVMDEFEAAFPGVTVEHTAYNSVNIWAPRAQQERQAGVYTWDVAIQGTTTSIRTLKPQGFFDPIRSLLIHPEVTNDGNWSAGFEAGFIENDKPQATAYSFGWQRFDPFWANFDLIKQGDIKSVQDLLDPKWKGKIAVIDPRTVGDGYLAGTIMRLKHGDDFLKRLFVDQQPVISRDLRQIIEWVVKGQHAFSLGGRHALLSDFREQGIGKNVDKYYIEDGAWLWGGSPIFLMNRAPHPNAARLFINWVLTKAGQTAWVKHTKEDSRRRDVDPVDPKVYPAPGDEKKYTRLDQEEIMPKIEETQEIARKLLG